MTSISLYMHDEHARCDAGLELTEAALAAGDWHGAALQFEAFRAAMLRHLRVEEDVLFPAFEQATGSYAGPTVVMRNEHRQLRTALMCLRAAMGAQDAGEFAAQSDTLRILLGQHNLKEEGILYPMADHALCDSASELVAEMEAIPLEDLGVPA